MAYRWKRVLGTFAAPDHTPNGLIGKTLGAVLVPTTSDRIMVMRAPNYPTTFICLEIYILSNKEELDYSSQGFSGTFENRSTFIYRLCDNDMKTPSAISPRRSTDSLHRLASR